MKSFNKIFKEILLQNQFYVSDNKFPQAFSFADYGLEFIFDIMPTFGPQYIWHTIEDLKAIPELITALKNTDISVLQGIADGFYDAADAEEDEYPNEEMQQPEKLREISEWIRTIKNEQMLYQSDDLNIHDSQCFNTVPNVVKEVRPRAYRRGLKALSLANRTKFNQDRLAQLNNIEQPKSKTDILNKVKDPIITQQPITKDVIKPVLGVKRPLGLNRTQKPIKHTFSNMVYQPSITQITKQTAKKRCLTQRKKSTIKEDTDDELQFTTDYSQPVQPYVPEKEIDDTQLPIKKKLCIICKEYVQPRETILKSGKKIYECPKCGLRLPESNY